MHIRPLAAALILSACASQPQIESQPAKPAFATFLKQLQIEAKSQGLPGDMIADAFGDNPQPFLQVVQAQANQPEIQDAFAQYLNKILSETRINKGRELKQTYALNLNRAQNDTGVPPEVIVALWGVETAYGKVTGNIPVIKALATLAYTDARRPGFFRQELMSALRVAEQTDRNAETLLGSWAGAVGQNQFMPSNWAKLGKDGDGDGKVNLIESVPDVIASTANYLQKAGWQKGQGWKWHADAPAKPLPEDAKLNARGLSEPFKASQWQAWGVTPPKDVAAGTALRFYQPQGQGGPTYFVGPNFDVILDWNYSSYFAFSVLTLAELIKAER